MNTWLPVHKPPAFTSHDVVAVARKALGIRKIGHSGTLDPDATGVLVLAIGKATRLIAYLPGEKAYRATIRLGIETDTQDASGQIISERRVPMLTQGELEERLHNWVGEQKQIPPMVSAISYQGKRLYQLARQGVRPEEIPLSPRSITLYQIQFLSYQAPLLSIWIHCSSGTYIRTLAHDLGQQLGCGAHLQQLQRTMANGFIVDQAISLEAIHQATGYPLDFPLRHLPALNLSEEDANKIAQGQWVPQDDRADPFVRLYAPQGQLIGIGTLSEGMIKPKVIVSN